MGRYIGPKHKLCRAEGIALCGSPKCPVVRKNAGPPGQHGLKRRKKISEYGIQLREKQRAKRMYGVFEKQFKKYFQNASSQKSQTSEALLRLLETRLDNVVFRLNLARSRPQARQLVVHGHLKVNSKKVTIPSYNVKIGDIISLSAKAANYDFIKKLVSETKEAKMPPWLERKATVGKVLAQPQNEDFEPDLNPRLIIEYYSR